jgi:Protein of unknown function (DUF3592)
VTSVLSAFGAGEIEFGAAILGLVIAALPLAMLGAWRRRMLLSFRGRRTVGKVTRVERTGPRTWQAHLSFRAGEGSEISVACSVPQRTRPGDSVRIRYDRAHPELATTRSAVNMALLIVLPLTAVAALGLVGVFGTLYTAGAGGFDSFINGYFIALFIAIALFCFYSAYLRYVRISRWRDRTVATGVVDHFETSERPGRAGTYACITFTAKDGSKIAFKEQPPKPLKPGASVTVYYDPEIPQQTSTIVGRSRGVGRLLLPAMVGVLVSAFAVVLLLS